jgi:uncharacterized membrane protein YkoI
MELRKTLMAGLTSAALAVPAAALAASATLPTSPTTTPMKAAAHEDEPKAAEAAENDRAADRTEGTITERSASFDGHKLAGGTSINLATARAAALAARAGQITDQELERERGGSGLRYSFDIKNGTKVYEVGVDAKTGKILENAIEGPIPD